MVSTPFSLSSTAHIMLPREDCNRVFPKIKRSFSFGFAIAFASFVFVSALVPENPHQLASMCEKYNSAAACRVW